MTRDEILAMELGRELDALVAEKVMGWTVFREKHNGYELEDDEIAIGYPPGEDINSVPYEIEDYSTHIQTAWVVFNKIKDLGAWIEVAWNPKKKHYRCAIGANFTNGKLKTTIDENKFQTAPEAICKAALIAG